LLEQAPSASDASPYVQSMTLDGAAWNAAYLPGSVFSEGGMVNWDLSSAPDTSWGSASSDAPQSNTNGLLPALGYVAGSEGKGLAVAPGSSANLEVGARNLQDVAQSVSWTASPSAGSGITVSPEGGGSITAPGSAEATEKVHVEVPASTQPGQYLISFSMEASGTNLPTVVEVVTVTKAASLER
jgi:hypothetical protein